jgi:hypothetical protein
VEKGKIRYIHTISTCEGHPGCGLNGTYVPLDPGKKRAHMVGNARLRSARRGL